MIGLPKSTEFGRRIPKQKFYDNLSVSPALKRAFVEQIKAIHWRNKISPATMNLAPGTVVKEIQVFEIALTGPRLDESVLRQIDREIPYHILFLLEYEGRYQAWTAYKEPVGAGANAFKVGAYYHTDFLEPDRLPLRVDGLDMDRVYEALVRQIAGEALQAPAEESLKESVERDAKRKALEKQIAALEGKIRREKQFNRQVEMNTALKKLKSEWRKL